jgi:hypothetical protein
VTKGSQTKNIYLKSKQLRAYRQIFSCKNGFIFNFRKMPEKFNYLYTQYDIFHEKEIPFEKGIFSNFRQVLERKTKSK